jgi:hypothetical protein
LERMVEQVRSPEERRLMILSGLRRGYVLADIAAEIGVGKSVVVADIRSMKYVKDPELRKVYQDKETHLVEGRDLRRKMRDAQFRMMTGMSFEEKNFSNMINYYKVELQGVLRSPDERFAISCLSKNVRRVLKQNNITVGHGRNEQLSVEARDYLSVYV